MNDNFIDENFKRIIHGIEVIIAIILMIGIIIGLIDLVKYLFEILKASPSESYGLFQSFLGHALLLIVGAELISMILYHSNRALLELLLFVIARKMLIYANTMADLVLGSIAIAIVFATLRYLIKSDREFSKEAGKEEAQAIPKEAKVEKWQ